MAGIIRHPARRAVLEDQARALREGGASMVEVSEAVGVPVSTLYQWAARGKWRLGDLAEGEGEAVTEPDDGGSMADEPETPDAPVDTSPAEAGRMALRQASQALAAGRIVAADKAVRLAERFFTIASRAGHPVDPEAPAEWDGLLPCGLTEAELIAQREQEILAEFETKRRLIGRLQTHQSNAIDNGRIPRSGMRFEDYVARYRVTMIEAIAVGLIPEELLEEYGQTLYNLAMMMRRNLRGLGLIGENWYQADEPDFPPPGLYENGPPGDAPDRAPARTHQS